MEGISKKMANLVLLLISITFMMAVILNSLIILIVMLLTMDHNIMLRQGHRYHHDLHIVALTARVGKIEK